MAVWRKIKDLFVSNTKCVTKFKIKRMNTEFKERYNTNPHFFYETVKYPMGIMVVEINNRTKIIDVIHRKEYNIDRIKQWLEGFGLKLDLLKTRPLRMLGHLSF